MRKLNTVVQSLSSVQPFATPWTAAHQAPLSFTFSQNFLKFMSIESVMLCNHLILCRPLLFPPSIFPNIRVFSSESALHIRWPKYWSFSFSISPSNEFSELISFRMDWFDLLEVQRALKNQVISSTTIWKHQFLGAQPSLWSNSYLCTWLLAKTIALTVWTFVGKVMPLLFSMVSRLVLAFLPRSKHLLISWQSLSAVILEPKKVKSVTASTFSPSICHEVPFKWIVL